MRINFDEACRRAKVIKIIIKTVLYSNETVSFSFRIWDRKSSDKQHARLLLIRVMSQRQCLKKASFGFLSIGFSALKVKIKLLIIRFYKRKQTMHKCEPVNK